MPKNKIADLRDHLFATLEALRDEEKPMDIERAKAIADVARVVVDSAKVEVAFLEATGAAGTGFIPVEATPERPRLAATSGGGALRAALSSSRVYGPAAASRTRSE